ncbi:MAG: N-acetylmuramoyl-L-alanine amidase [Candidatus Lindowbacteria bacterium]|nr:N-acetylmuramoyl-L-alanine amidase [Candidatus Lindowbacteria bacterium]
MPDLARFLGVATHWKPADEKLLLTYKSHNAEIFIGTGHAKFDGRPVSFASPIVAATGSVTASITDAAALFSRLLERVVTEKEISDGLASGWRVDAPLNDGGATADLRDGVHLPGQSTAWAEQEPGPLPKQAPFTTVVIDPGHGGKDYGARGRGGLTEKDVALNVALKLKERIEAAGLKVVLTRTDDLFVPLRERTSIANHAKNGAPADLFISIHANSHTSPSVDGFEAYYVSDAIDPGAEATAAIENAVIGLEEGEETGKSSLTSILWDLQYAEFIFESSELAFIVQEELGKRLDARDRGVRQARFIVLSGVAMPSVLVELGFISNRAEEAKLKTEGFKNECSESLGAAVLAFKERYETKLGLLNGGSKP